MKIMFLKTLKRRIFNRIYTIFLTKIKEKNFRVDNIVLKYILLKSKEQNRPLIVSFPACWSKGAKYNYIGTLKSFNCNKLFLLDDATDNRRGNYLIGKGYVEIVINLLEKIIKETKPSKVIFIGSSKGGYSALFYSFFIKNVDVCIAAPQYHLGSYLNQMEDKRNLQSIIGEDITNEKIAALDRYFSDVIEKSSIVSNVVFIQYSNVEHTYEEHIKDLIYDLRKKEICIKEDIKSYPDHGDVVFYFPSFLKDTIKSIIR